MLYVYGHTNTPSAMTRPCGCCATENLKGTTYIWSTEEQAKPNLAMIEGWILWSKIVGDLKTLSKVGNISGYFRSVVREAGNIVTVHFRRPGGISWVWKSCRWERSLCYHTCQPMGSELSCETGRLRMQVKYKAEARCLDHARCDGQQSARPLRAYFVYS